MRGATLPWRVGPAGRSISTHTPHAGRNTKTGTARGGAQTRNFNSHAPCGAQHIHGTCAHEYAQKISTHTPHAGRNRPGQTGGCSDPQSISTHTPHAGRNPTCILKNIKYLNPFQLTRPMRGATGRGRGATQPPIHFNSHAPCGAQHQNGNCAGWGANPKFQLTRPMRGATENRPGRRRPGQFQLTRPMRGATAARGGGGLFRPRFQLTRPMRGATWGANPNRAAAAEISTHTPHAGRNTMKMKTMIDLKLFQLTRPMRGATGGRGRGSMQIPIHFNSHAPCGAQPPLPWRVGLRPIHFNSHAPCGAQRAAQTRGCSGAQSISTHTPHAGRNHS